MTGHRKPAVGASKSDGDFIQSLMKPCFEAGHYASWIAPPKVGINNQPGDFEYVSPHGIGT